MSISSPQIERPVDVPVADRRGLDGSHLVYRDFTGPLSPRVAGLCLLAILCALVAGETLCRLIPHRYARTPISSLHGIRAIYQEALADPHPKDIAVGDSTLIGGGVHDHNSIFLQQIQRDLPGIHIYNLAQPGGDNLTGSMILRALARDHVPNVDRVIIEVLPGKFIGKVGEAPQKPSWDGTPGELIRFLPQAGAAQPGLPPHITPIHERVQSWLEYKAGVASALYARRDFFRIEYAGNYPIFYLINVALPDRLKRRVLSGSFRGTNRFGARVEDYPYAGSSVTESGRFYFDYAKQGPWLADELAAAGRFSKRPPIVIVNPVHYEYDRLDPAAARSYEKALRDTVEACRTLCARTGATLFVVDSTQFQDPSLWFLTRTHFNEKGHAQIYRQIGPAVVKALRSQ